MKITNIFKSEHAIRKVRWSVYNPLNVTYTSYDKIGYSFFLLAVFLIPFDSFPIFPVSTVYRPISELMLLITFLVIVRRGRLYKPSLIFLAIVLLIVAQSILASVLWFKEYDHISKMVITSVLFFVVLLVLYQVIRENYQNRGEKFLEVVTKILVASSVFISIIGIIQVLGIFGIIPKSLYKGITLLFAYRTTDAARIQLVSGEPSMLVRNLMFLAPFIYYYYKGRFRKMLLALFVFFVLLAGSTFGYLIIGLYFVVDFILFKFSRRSFLVLLTISSLGLGIITYAYSNILDRYTQQKLEKVVQVVKNPKTLELIISKDGSIFQRIINPYIGFLSGDYSYFLGIGSDNYRYIYPEYINSHFPYAKKYHSVNNVLTGKSYITSKSLYARIYTEFGVIPFIMYGVLLLWMYLRIRNLKYNKRLYSFLSTCFVLVIVFIVNFDSLIYFTYLFLLIMIIVILQIEGYSKLKTVEKLV